MLSRVADSLYWMARYLERAEHASRVLSVKLEAMLEQTPEDAADASIRVVASLSWPLTAPVAGTLDDNAHQLTLDRHEPSSVFNAIRLARDNARQVRELISTEMWQQLNTQYLRLHGAEAEAAWSTQPVQFLQDIVSDLLLFAGTTDSTMRHGEGWHFIQLGRYVERAQVVARLVDLYFGTVPADVTQALRAPRYFDWLSLLKQCTAFEAYCKVYTADIKPAKVAEFLIFDPEFPHSIRFATDRIQEELSHVAPGAGGARRMQAERLAGRLKAQLDYGQVEELLAGDIDGFLRGIQDSCKQIHQSMFDAFIGYSVDELLTA